eukprot:TRINITY_DN23909_c0_g1_i1.p2 TRINITY_DN23909_c0_g1~~TRINITY_DN23909_c0_g1_i1.p2  ORF type:complete len:142 (-),score=26.14 TRINITY_DN23909_c0_g1_i1:268-693(-)
MGLVATASEDKAARLFDLEGSLLACFQFESGCCEIALDAESEVVLATSADGTLRLWQIYSHSGGGAATDAFVAEREPVGVAHHQTEVHGAASLLSYGRVLSGTAEGDFVEWSIDKISSPWQVSQMSSRKLFEDAAVSISAG